MKRFILLLAGSLGIVMLPHDRTIAQDRRGDRDEPVDRSLFGGEKYDRVEVRPRAVERRRAAARAARLQNLRRAAAWRARRGYVPPVRVNPYIPYETTIYRPYWINAYPNNFAASAFPRLTFVPGRVAAPAGAVGSPALGPSLLSLGLDAQMRFGINQPLVAPFVVPAPQTIIVR